MSHLITSNKHTVPRLLNRIKQDSLPSVMPSVRGRSHRRRRGTTRPHPYRDSSRQSQPNQSSLTPSTSTYFNRRPPPVAHNAHHRQSPYASSRLAITSPIVRGEEDDDDLNEIIMAVDSLQRGTIGCSYYVASTETLHVMCDMKFGDEEIVQRREFCLKFQNLRWTSH